MATGASIDTSDSDNRLKQAFAATASGEAAPIMAFLSGPDADPEARQNGFTLLHIAAAKGQTHIAGMLLDRGCAIDAKSNAGVTPLVVAAVQGHADIVEMLLKRGADAEVRGAQGESVYSSLHRRGMLEDMGEKIRGWTDEAMRERRLREIEDACKTFDAGLSRPVTPMKPFSFGKKT